MHVDTAVATPSWLPGPIDAWAELARRADRACGRLYDATLSPEVGIHTLSALTDGLSQSARVATEMGALVELRLSEPEETLEALSALLVAVGSAMTLTAPIRLLGYDVGPETRAAAAAVHQALARAYSASGR